MKEKKNRLPVIELSLCGKGYVDNNVLEHDLEMAHVTQHSRLGFRHMSYTGSVLCNLYLLRKFCVSSTFENE